MRIPFYLALLSTLVACTVLQPYVEPVPSQDTARLRVVAPIGVNATVGVFPNSDGFCFDRSRKDGQELPIHLNSSGINGKASKKIGMINVNEISRESGTEFYVSTKEPIIFTTFSSANTFNSKIHCNSAFKFHFEAGKDYEVTLDPNSKGCSSGISDITNFKPGDKLVPLVATPIIVIGSPAWDLLCKTSN